VSAGLKTGEAAVESEESPERLLQAVVEPGGEAAGGRAHPRVDDALRGAPVGRVRAAPLAAGALGHFAAVFAPTGRDPEG
jgi:hypothetical protein